MSSTQIIIILKNFKDFFACKIVLAANYHYPENIQRVFRQQSCLICKSSLSWKYWRLFRLQNCLRRKSSSSWKYSKNFSPAKFAQTQIIIILKLFKDLFACKIVLAVNHLYPGNIQRLFCLQNCLSRQSSLSWNYSKTFCLQNCLSRESSLSWKYSITFSPAKMSWPEIIIIPKIFRDFFACKSALAANHHYPEKIQRLFRLQNCLRRKSSISWIYSKTFSPAKLS